MQFIDNSVGACFLLGHPIDSRCVNRTYVSCNCVHVLPLMMRQAF